MCVGGEYLGHLGGLFDFEYGLFSRLIVLNVDVDSIDIDIDSIDIDSIDIEIELEKNKVERG